MGEIQLESVDQSIQQGLPAGYECESIFTVNNPSYRVLVCFVDLQNVMWDIEHSYSKYDTLIKYSKAKYSPVSPEPADCIRLATPLYYRNLETEANSELIADDLEGLHIDFLNWDRKGGPAIEFIKKKLAGPPLYLGNSSINLKLTTRARDNYWMYCTSIDPGISYEREEQSECLSSSYNFMTKIEKPSTFAKQFGFDIGKQIELHRDLKHDSSTSRYLLELIRNKGWVTDDYIISVNHGPVIYLEEDQRQEFINDVSEGSSVPFVPFIKDKKYEKQREYRFLVSVNFHSPKKEHFHLKISEDLRILMSPIEDFYY